MECAAPATEDLAGLRPVGQQSQPLQRECAEAGEDFYEGDVVSGEAGAACAADHHDPDRALGRGQWHDGHRLGARPQRPDGVGRWLEAGATRRRHLGDHTRAVERDRRRPLPPVRQGEELSTVLEDREDEEVGAEAVHRRRFRDGRQPLDGAKARDLARGAPESPELRIPPRGLELLAPGTDSQAG